MASKKTKKTSSKKATTSAAPNGVVVPRSNVGATVQAMVAEGARSVSAVEATSTEWVVTRLA
ncbi:MAG: hypothetical protein KF830_15120 [Planctomycetes bacterium]|nr:hypothetical protein [Planctomycetota bacterium]